MDKNKYRIILAVLLAVLVIVSFLLQILFKPEKAVSIQPEKTAAKEKESDSETQKKTDDAWMTKSRIKEYQNQPDDNQGTLTPKLDITFKGYKENPEAFSWMDEQEWKNLQESLKRYLEKKGFRDVTEVNLHPDSIQKINDYERNVYMDMNHENVYTKKIVLKVICDTYTDVMRFAFNVQYGS